MPSRLPFRILLISGSLRSRSTNTAAQRTAQVVAPPGLVTVLYDELADLPAFNPDDDVIPLHPVVARLRAAIHAADALLFSTPEYAGALPGSFKNLLDWTIGDEQPGSIYEKPVAWINVALRGADDAHDSLRKVLGFAHANIIEAACRHIPVTAEMIGADDLIGDLSARNMIGEALITLAANAGPLPDHG